jgi:hypothetical protein
MAVFSYLNIFYLNKKAMSATTKICKGQLCNGIEKNISEFSIKNPLCKKCHCERIKNYYKENDRSYRKLKTEIRRDSECRLCGCKDIRLLEFDHISTKNINICKSFSKQKIQEELKYVQVICIWCHRLKTRKDLDEDMSKKYEIENRPTDETEGKKCNGNICNGLLQYSNLFKKINICSLCDSYNARQRRMNNYNFIKETKMKIGKCELCSIEVNDKNFFCFDFDHIKDKKINISNLINKSFNTIDRITEEITKCRLLCCKCHKIHTAEQLSYIYK